MAIDLVLLTTLIVSIGDVLINIVGFCCTGHIKTNCCNCFSYEKDDDELTKEEITSIENAVRRGSGISKDQENK
jgi:hypothetical protein